MSSTIFHVAKLSHATVVIRNFSRKQHEGRTSNFTCNTRSLFYMITVTISFLLDRKFLVLKQGLRLAWLDAGV